MTTNQEDKKNDTLESQETSSSHDSSAMETPEPPITKRQLRWLATVAISLVLLFLSPNIIADYLTSRLLVLPSSLRHSSRKLKLPYRNIPILFRGEKNLLLQGWLFTSSHPNKRLLFYLHDLGADHEEGRDIIRYLLAYGFDVFAFDQRGHGLSEGKIALHPLYQSRDVGRAYRLLRKMYPRRWRQNYGMIGKGFGATAALLFAARDSHFRVMIAVNPLLDFPSYLELKLKKYPKLIRNLTIKRVKRAGHIDFFHSSPLNKTRYYRRLDTLFIYEKNFFIPPKDRNFCNKKGSLCQKMTYAAKKGRSWWRSLSKSQQLEVTYFLKRPLGLPAPKRARIPKWHSFRKTAHLRKRKIRRKSLHRRKKRSSKTNFLLKKVVPSALKIAGTLGAPSKLKLIPSKKSPTSRKARSSKKSPTSRKARSSKKSPTSRKVQP